MVKMEFKKTDLKSRLLSGSYRKEDDQASACSTNTSQKSSKKDGVEMFSDDEETVHGDKKKDPKLGYCYCGFTLVMFVLLSIYVAA